jgi:hypothetical protein
MNYALACAIGFHPWARLAGHRRRERREGSTRARERVDEADIEKADTEPDVLARLFRFDERFYRLRRDETTP